MHVQQCAAGRLPWPRCQLAAHAAKPRHFLLRACLLAALLAAAAALGYDPSDAVAGNTTASAHQGSAGLPLAQHTIDAINANAPVFPTGQGNLGVKPVLSYGPIAQNPTRDYGKTDQYSQKAAAARSYAASGAQTTSGGNPDEPVTGQTISFEAGVRISTPFFASGFDFCVDYYFGSFPKVGVVIPNAAAALLPEFQSMASQLRSTLMLPNDPQPGGLRAVPTQDGLLIMFPQTELQPSSTPDFAYQYSVQIGQIFGVNFGFGLLKTTCTVAFVVISTGAGNYQVIAGR